MKNAAGHRLALSLAAALFVQRVSLPAVARAAPTQNDPVATKALAQTDALVAAYKTCGNVATEHPCAALDQLFDFNRLTEAPMAGHLSQLSAAQKKRFFAAFGRVIRAAARRSGNDLTVGSPAKSYVGSFGDNAKVDVHIARPEDDVDAHIGFVWRAKGGSWQIVDVELDGASMVQDYHNQFGRVLKKDGAEALVTKVESRGGAAQKKAE